jgi:hypothetical protein
MNSSGYHEMKSSRKRTTHNSLETIHIHDHLGFARVPFDEDSRKSPSLDAGYYIVEILEPLSQWRSIEAAGNERLAGEFDVSELANLNGDKMRGRRWRRLPGDIFRIFADFKEVIAVILKLLAAKSEPEEAGASLAVLSIRLAPFAELPQVKNLYGFALGYCKEEFSLMSRSWNQTLFLCFDDI